MNFSHSIALLFIIVNMSCNKQNTSINTNDQSVHPYHTVIEFELNNHLRFHDFILEHTKHKKIQGPNNAKWYRQTFYFTVKDEQLTQEIAWSTGRTHPTKFTVNGQEYELVMGSYQDPTAQVTSIITLELNELMIVKRKTVKLSTKKIKTGDIVFRSTNKKNGVVLFNEYGQIEKNGLGLFVWDTRNTLKQPLNRWSAQSIDKKIIIMRKNLEEFEMSELAMQAGSYNFLFETPELTLITKNFE